MRYLGLLLVVLAVAVSACEDKSDAPQVEQSGSQGAAARQWASKMPAFYRDLNDALAEHAAFTSDVLATWGTPQQPPASRVISNQARFNGLLLRAQALPEGTPEVNAVNSAFVRGLGLAVQAYDSYRAGIEEGRFNAMVRGDDLMAKSQAEFAKTRFALEKVVGKSPEGSIDAEGKKMLPALTFATDEANKAFDLFSESVSALKDGDTKEAERLTKEAKRHVDEGASRLEALEPPDSEELQAYLQKTIDGLRHLSDALANSAKGIKKLDLKLMRDGAQEAEKAVQELSNAREELFQALRSQ